MHLREARTADIPQIQFVRNAVKENTLSDPGLVTYEDVAAHITRRGKGWVCELDDRIVGFAIVDLQEHNIWALFMDPRYERQGIGRRLHDTMLEWYFSQTHDTVWLGTAFHTRAEAFYRKAGWTEAGTHGAKEIRFEMSYENWSARKDR